MDELKKLYEQRLLAHNEAKHLVDEAKKNSRELTEDEQRKTDELLTKVEELTKSIKELEAGQRRQKAVDDNDTMLRQSAGRITHDVNVDGRTAPPTVELRKSVTGERRTVELTDRVSEDDANTTLRQRLFVEAGIELRTTLQAGSDTGGGYFVPPLVMQAGIIKNLDDMLFLRQICTVLPPLPTADSLGIMSLDSDPDDPTSVGELATGSEDTSTKFGMRALTPHPVARYVKLSETLIRKHPAIEQFVLSRFQYKFARREEYLFLYGTGAEQPLGLMTASSYGISTGRDVNTDMPASGTNLNLEGLKEVFWTLKPAYRMRASWLVGTGFLKRVDKLRDGEGRYIWQPSVVPGQPDRLLNRPYYESWIMDENTTWTSANYIGILGDFSYYHIVDALTMRMLKLVELYAATNQIAWQLRKEMDGAPMLEEAFVRVKLA